MPYPLSCLSVLFSKNRTNAARDVEAIHLQTASAPIASASKQIHRNFASKMRPVLW